MNEALELLKTISQFEGMNEELNKIDSSKFYIVEVKLLPGHVYGRLKDAWVKAHEMFEQTGKDIIAVDGEALSQISLRDESANRDRILKDYPGIV